MAMSSPADGGFAPPGGPPPGGQPPGGQAPGGFGAPGSQPGSQPGGGFGSAPGSQPGGQPGGGFGSAPGSSPGAPGGGQPGGFGAPGGAAPGGAAPGGGQGGFGAPPAQGGQQGFGAPPAGGAPPGGGAGAAPQKKKSKLPMILGLGCVGLIALSCFGWIAWAFVAPMVFGSSEDDVAEVLEEASAEAAEAEGESGDGAGGGGPCSRIADCCRAYVDAMGGSVPANTCDAYDNVVGLQDATCEQTMAGYRSGLQAMNKAVPAACN
jgi:collagen type III alpha